MLVKEREIHCTIAIKFLDVYIFTGWAVNERMKVQTQHHTKHLHMLQAKQVNKHFSKFWKWTKGYCNDAI